MSRTIEHKPEQHRFEWTEDGALSLLDYHLHNKLMTITHTEVPPRLADAALLRILHGLHLIQRAGKAGVSGRHALTPLRISVGIANIRTCLPKPPGRVPRVVLFCVH